MSIDDENFVSLGERLREERNRIGLSQVKLADLCGLSREMIGKYETGRNVPGGEVLFLLAKAGADIGYILTGQRTAKENLSYRDLALLNNMKECSEEDRRLIEQLALRVAEAKPQEVTDKNKKKVG
jgi:transcriptional regulator with XRE-family HTH domain